MSRSSSAWIVGAAALVLAALWFVRADDGWLESAAPDVVELATPNLDDAATGRASPSATGDGGRTDARASASRARPGALRLSGLLTRSDDGSPAAFCRLHVQSGSESVEVRTDADGRFATEAVLARGMVQLYHLPDSTRAEYARSLPIVPGQVVLFGDVEREFLLRVPDCEIEVLVHEGGRPFAGARVHWRVVRGVERGFEYASSETRSDRRGRARFGFHSGNDDSRLEVHAESGELRSATVELAPPWPLAPISLPLVLGGRLRLRTVDEAHQPLAHRTVRVMRNADDPKPRDLWTTDDRGRHLSAILVPGPYRLVHVADATGERFAVRAVVHPGQITDVDLEIEHLKLDVAAAGRVVDEDGEPLAGVEVALLNPDAGLTTVSTAADGTFELRAPRCDRVRVALDHDPWGDQFEPGHVDVRFGRTDLEFERLGPPAFVGLELEVVDAESREAIEDAVILVHRPPYTDEHGQHRTLRGRARLTCPDVEGLELRVAARGYRTETLTLASLFEPTDPTMPHRRVALERGLRARLRAVTSAAPVDHRSLVPLPRAHVVSDGAIVATADDDGWIELDLHVWPDRLQLAHEGLASVELDPGRWIEDVQPPTIEMR